MGVAGNTTDLKLADTAGEQATGRPNKLAAWNTRRVAVQGQIDALISELATIDAMGIRDLGCGLKATIQPDGSVVVNAGTPLGAAASMILRDHLCDVLGLPEPLSQVTTLSEVQAKTLAANLAERALAAHQNIAGTTVFRAVHSAIYDALNHVGVIQSKQPNEQHNAASIRPGAPASASGEPERSAGTAGSAQYEVSFNSESLHRVIEILDNTVRLIERVHNRGAISQDEFAEIGKKLSTFTVKLGLEATRVAKPANPNAASDDWNALHGVNEDGNVKGERVDVSA